MIFKKKFLKTGEIVHVVGWNGEDDKRRKTDWVSYIDSKGGEHEMVKGLNYHWDFDDVDTYELYEKREHERNVNGHFCLFAGMAMKSLIRLNQGVMTKESIVKEAVGYAKLLTEELSKWVVDVEKDEIVKKEK